MKLPARKEPIISLLLSFPLGFLRGKRNSPLRPIMSAMTSHDPFPFSSTSTSFNHTSIQHLQTHSSPSPSIATLTIQPKAQKEKRKNPPINSSNSHNSPPNLYTAVHNPVHNASATPTLPSLHNTVHTTPPDPPTPLLHFDQIYNRCDRELFGLCRLEQAFLRSAGERGRLRVGRLGGWIFRFGFFR